MTKCKICGKENNPNKRYCSVECRKIGISLVSDRTLSPETRLKMSVRAKLRVRSAVSNNTKKKISITLKKLYSTGKLVSARKNKKRSPESNHQQSISQKMRFEKNPILRKNLSIIRKKLFAEGKLLPPQLGKKMSNETKKRLSISQKVLYAKNPEMRDIHRMHTIRLIKEGHTRMSNTLPERQIKAYLHTKNLIEGKDWIHQHYINDIEHKYVADFILPKIKTIIECDGNYFHANDDSIKNELSNKQKYRVTIDDLRTKELREQGYIVLRFWESDIKKRFEKISQSLDMFIKIYKGDYHRW